MAEIDTTKGCCKYCGMDLEPGELCPKCGADGAGAVPRSRQPARPAPVAEGTAYLLCLESQERFNLRNGGCSIGRHQRNEVCVDDPYLSRFHARIVYAQGRYYVEDLGSTNGTVVNSEPIEGRRPISPGDRIKVGRTELEFRQGE